MYDHDPYYGTHMILHVIMLLYVICYYYYGVIAYVLHLSSSITPTPPEAIE